MKGTLYEKRKKATKVVGSFSKTRNVVHNNNPVEFVILSQNAIIIWFIFFFSLKIFDYNPKFNNILWVQKLSRNIKTRSYLMSSFFWKYNFCYPQNILNFSKHVVFSKFWTKVVLPHPVCPKTSIFPGNFPSYKYFSIFILDLICEIELFELSFFFNFRYQCIFCCYLDPRNNIWNFVTIFVHKDLTFHLTKSFIFHS